jgi:voltage-gated potassium channel Kch
MDGWFSSGPMGPVLSLGALTLVIIFAAALVLVRTGLAPGAEPGYTFIEAFWTAMVRALGGGSMGGRETAWGYRLLMFAITLGSIFVVSLLIGTLTNSITSRIDELRKGRTIVAESNHIVILGWTDQIMSILHELAQANAHKKGSRIVVMAQRDKTFMEDTIRRKLAAPQKTRIICRTGNPMEPDDLKILNLNQSRSIIILSPDSDSRDADVIKTVLAITNHSQRRGQPYNIVASICDPRNFAVAKVAGKQEVEWIPMGILVARVIAQTSRQSGLSVIYSELLNYRDNEIYFHEGATLVGRRFGEILSLFSQDSVIGITREGGRVHLNPPMETVIELGDKIVVIARDNTLIAADPLATTHVQEGMIHLDPLPRPKPERTLILGWNWRVPIVIENLDQYVLGGSEVTVMTDQRGVKEPLLALRERLKSQKLRLLRGDITDRQTLEKLDLSKFHHVVVMSYSDTRTQQQADASSMIALLHLRDLADKNGYNFTLTSEMLDDRNRKLAMVTRADDFVVSERLVSMMMAQVAENRAVNLAFEDLLNPEGSEIYLRPVQSYVRLGHSLTYATLVEAARRRGEVAIGYRLAASIRDPEKYFGVVLNPPKSTEVIFGEEDRVIVLGQ